MILLREVLVVVSFEVKVVTAVSRVLMSLYNRVKMSFNC